MLVAMFECAFCGSVLLSRTNHDFKRCKCEKLYTDGGFSTIRTNGNHKSMLHVEIDINEKALYDDWNYKKDEWGLFENRNSIPGKIVKEFINDKH